ncbi:MAG: sigma-70 family RNA polymerase sigma factor, partial [Planctomycetota bacterium]
MATPNPSNHPTDEQLLERARGGDREAFADLVRRYETPVYSMSFRMLSHREDARDLAQEIFLTVYQSLERFRGEAQFKTWLYRVTVNRCRDELRKRKTVKHTQPASLASLAPDEEGRVPEPPGREPSPEAAARAAA